MKPEVKVFSREQPCTKLEIWETFRHVRSAGFVRVPVPDAQAKIGANVPRVMEREGRLVRVVAGQTEYYALTEEGEEWLYEGFKRYLKNHPAHAALARNVPAEWGYGGKAVRLRRTR